MRVNKIFFSKNILPRGWASSWHIKLWCIIVRSSGTLGDPGWSVSCEKFFIAYVCKLSASFHSLIECLHCRMEWPLPHDCSIVHCSLHFGQHHVFVIVTKLLNVSQHQLDSAMTNKLLEYYQRPTSLDLLSLWHLWFIEVDTKVGLGRSLTASAASWNVDNRDNWGGGRPWQASDSMGMK